MKTYYLTVGLAGLAAALYVGSTWHAEPWWISFILGYATATPIATAINMYLKEHRRP